MTVQRFAKGQYLENVTSRGLYVRKAGPDQPLQAVARDERGGEPPHAVYSSESTSLQCRFHELAEVEEISGTRLPGLLDQETVYLSV